MQKPFEITSLENSLCFSFASRWFGKFTTSPKGWKSKENFHGIKTIASQSSFRTEAKLGSDGFYKGYATQFYDPISARFTTPDPFVQNPAFSQDFNRYSYVNNNPMRYTDPSGYLALLKLKPIFLQQIGLPCIAISYKNVKGNVSFFKIYYFCLL